MVNVLLKGRGAHTQISSKCSRRNLNISCHRHQSSCTPVAIASERRTVLLGSLAAISTAFIQPAQAGVLDGTVAWWIGRKRANSAKLIAPIKVAQQRLETASMMLAKGTGSLVDVLQLVRSSSLNCYMFEALPSDTLETRASLLTQSTNISDPCTFRIVIKNVVDFASEEDKERGAQLLNSLILSYQKLDSELEAVALESGGAADQALANKAARQLAATLQLAYDVEGFVKELLLVA